MRMLCVHYCDRAAMVSTPIPLRGRGVPYPHADTNPGATVLWTHGARYCCVDSRVGRDWPDVPVYLISGQKHTYPSLSASIRVHLR